MDRDRGVRSGTSSGPGGKARCGQFTGDTQLSLLSAKNAGHTGLKPIMQAVFSTSTWHAFAGHVTFMMAARRCCHRGRKHARNEGSRRFKSAPLRHTYMDLARVKG